MNTTLHTYGLARRAGRAAARALGLSRGVACIVATILCWVASAVFAAAPGETYVYRVANGYNKEAQGQISYLVEKVDADRITLSVTTDVPSLGKRHTEILTKEGNWLRRPVVNHGQLVEYEFATVFPAYVFPLAIGKSWSMRVRALNPVTGRAASVRVDGNVLATERVQVPAGSFDTIKVRRRVYAGDGDGSRLETNIVETDWYAPELGRVIRSESNSHYQPGQCDDWHACVPVRGDWHVLELVEVKRAAPR